MTDKNQTKKKGRVFPPQNKKDNKPQVRDDNSVKTETREEKNED